MKGPLAAHAEPGQLTRRFASATVDISLIRVHIDETRYEAFAPRGGHYRLAGATKCGPLLPTSAALLNIFNNLPGTRPEIG